MDQLLHPMLRLGLFGTVLIGSEPGHAMVHLALSLGLVGLFLVAIVDSSFVPLPIPGLTDIMLVLFAAQRHNPVLLIAVAVAGSALGGWASYQVGHAGGFAFIEKRTPKKTFERVTRWMEEHAFLAVALPAILPPPMPLSPFVLVAGAVKMSQRRFMLAFTGSRLLRHGIAVWLGIHYGRSVLELWHRFTAQYGVLILVVLWTAILVSVAFALWQLWRTSRSVGALPRKDRLVADAARETI
jgi:membrane protein DedA with SNARE-associated domain